MRPLSKDLQEFIRLLQAERVEYVRSRNSPLTVSLPQAVQHGTLS